MNTTPAPAFLSCDAGGTRIKLGVVRSGRLLARAEIPAQAGDGLGPALDRLIRAARRCCREAGIDLREVQGFGLAFPGIIEPGTERILSTPAGKFDDAPRLGLPGSLADRLSLPVRLCNDANAALAGEWAFGAARGTRSAVMMTLGTGIGTSAIIDGVPLRGQHGQAGCLGGHWTAQVGGATCPCGNVGCAETLASTWALPRHARAAEGFNTSALAHTRVLDYAAVFHAASQGDRLARQLRDHAVAVWASTLVSLIHAYDPECVVLGGGIMRSRAFVLPRIRRHVAQHAWTPWGRPKVRAARLGDDAALLGMASLFPTAA
ncbi:MAG: ROK family protein [Verrucomicrobiales bacterium]|nr:ROK family protein [Verrucomicrobiales bacterium]